MTPLQKLLSQPPAPGVHEPAAVNMAPRAGWGVSMQAVDRVRDVSAAEVQQWLSTFDRDELLSAQAESDTTTPPAYLVPVRIRPPYEQQARLVVVDALRLPGAARWVAA